MGVLIDASILIEHERRRLRLDEHLSGREEEEFFLSAVTASELLRGVHRAGDAGVRARRSALVEAILERFSLLPVYLPTARAHARLRAQLARDGQLIGPHDMWLAACCLGHGPGHSESAGVRACARARGGALGEQCLTSIGIERELTPGT